MRESKNYESVRRKDEIFNWYFGFSVCPSESHLFNEALEPNPENVEATSTDLLSYYFTTWSPELTSSLELTSIQ